MITVNMRKCVLWLGIPGHTLSDQRALSEASILTACLRKHYRGKKQMVDCLKCLTEMLHRSKTTITV